MKFKKLAEMDDTQLQKKELDLERSLIKLQGSVATGSAPKDAGKIRQMKKDIARIATLLKQREVKSNE